MYALECFLHHALFCIPLWVSVYGWAMRKVSMKMFSIKHLIFLLLLVVLFQ